MHHPTERIAHTMACDTPVMEHWLQREIAQRVHHMKDRSDDPSHHERMPLPRSYISLPRLPINPRTVIQRCNIYLLDYLMIYSNHYIGHKQKVKKKSIG